MEDNKVITASNPNLLNDLAQKAMSAPVEQTIEPAQIEEPSETLVILPGGYVNSAGEVIKTAEVRELTGKDEEFMSKANTLSRGFLGLLERAVVKIGDLPSTAALLDELLIGDRDALLLGIYKATFGPNAQYSVWCSGCEDSKDVTINIDEDIEVVRMANPTFERQFTVKGKSHTYLVALPTGTTQKELISANEKTGAELSTILLEQTVLEIDDSPVISKLQVQNIGLADRRAIANELAKRTIGPKLEPIQLDCPDCNTKVVVPVNLGTLFRF
jgi:hypothetical protein